MVRYVLQLPLRPELDRQDVETKTPTLQGFKSLGCRFWPTGGREPQILRHRAVALYSAAKIVSWMNKFFMDDVPSKLHQLFYFSYGLWSPF
jgi:hypothetical protein